MTHEETAGYRSHHIVFDFILNQKTGTLVFQPHARKLYFDSGNLIFANSENEDEHFSEILVQMGILDSQSLQDVKETLEKGESLGKRLKDQGLATPKELAQALKQQITKIMAAVIQSGNDDCDIQDGQIPSKLPKLKIHTLALVLQAITHLQAPELFAELPLERPFSRSASFDEMLGRLDFPEHYAEFVDAVKDSASLTSDFLSKKLHWDRQLTDRIIYVLNLLNMIEFERAAVEPHDQFAVAPVVPVPSDISTLPGDNHVGDDVLGDLEADDDPSLDETAVSGPSEAYLEMEAMDETVRTDNLQLDEEPPEPLSGEDEPLVLDDDEDLAELPLEEYDPLDSDITDEQFSLDDNPDETDSPLDSEITDEQLSLTDESAGAESPLDSDITDEQLSLDDEISDTDDFSDVSLDEEDPLAKTEAEVQGSLFDDALDEDGPLGDLAPESEAETSLDDLDEDDVENPFAEMYPVGEEPSDNDNPFDDINVDDEPDLVSLDNDLPDVDASDLSLLDEAADEPDPLGGDDDANFFEESEPESLGFGSVDDTGEGADTNPMFTPTAEERDTEPMHVYEEPGNVFDDTTDTQPMAPVYEDPGETAPMGVVMPDEEEEELPPPKKESKSKLPLLAAILFLVVLIGGGSYYYLFMMNNDPYQPEPIQTAANDASGQDDADTATSDDSVEPATSGTGLEDSETTPASDQAASTDPGANPEDPIQDPEPVQPAEEVEAQPTTPDPEPVASQTQPEPAATPTRSPEPVRTQAPAVTGNQLSREDIGNLTDDSLRLLRDSGDNFSLAFMVACELETVNNIMAKAADREIFVFPRTIGGRSCYLLSWGMFSSLEEASAQRNTIPETLKNSEDPAWVVNLSKYR